MSLKEFCLLARDMVVCLVCGVVMEVGVGMFRVSVHGCTLRFSGITVHAHEIVKRQKSRRPLFN